MKKSIKNILIICAVVCLCLFVCSACENTKLSDDPSNNNSSSSFNLDIESLAYENDLSKFSFSVVTDEQNGDYVKVAKYNGNAEYVEIPSSVQIDGTSYEVREIGKDAFSAIKIDSSSLKYVKIPNTVTSIGSQAFDYCNNLLQMDIPSQVNFVGISALRGCNNLINLSLPFLGNNPDATFNNESTVQNSHLGFIFGSNATNGQGSVVPHSLREVEVTNAKTIQNYAFAYCSNLTKITLSNTITKIGDHAFFWCEGLTELSIPDSVVEMESSIFNGCSHLINLTVPFAGDSRGGVIGHIGYLFGADSKFEENAKYMPNTLRKIEVTDDNKIGDGAFYGLRNLTKIIVPDNVVSVATNAFVNCVSLEYNLKDKINYLGSKTNDYLIAVKVLEDYDKDVVVFDENCKFVTSGVCAMCENIKGIVFPSGTTTIGERAFYRCFSLESFTLPDNILSIEDSAFYGCVNLKEIVISDTSRLITIGDYAFYGCTSLTEFKITEKLTKIGFAAFKDCLSLSEVGINKMTSYLVMQLGNSFANPFYNCSKLIVEGSEQTQLVLPEGEMTIRSYAFANLKGITSVTIPSSTLVIASFSFYNMSDLTEIRYAGTMNDWQYVNTSPLWIQNSNVTQIICSDGVVDLTEI